MMSRHLVAGMAVGLGVLMYVGMFSIGPYLAPIVLALLWAEEAMARSADPVHSRFNPVQHFARVWFSPKGTIRRRTFWLAGILGVFAFQFTLSLVLLWADLGRGLEPSSGGLTEVASRIQLYVLFPYSAVVICAKRARDLGRSGWWGVAVLIPSAGVGLAEVAAQNSLPSELGPWLAAAQALVLMAFGVLPTRRYTA